jgi:hypothetical protein
MKHVESPHTPKATGDRVQGGAPGTALQPPPVSSAPGIRGGGCRRHQAQRRAPTRGDGRAAGGDTPLPESRLRPQP